MTALVAIILSLMAGQPQGVILWHDGDYGPYGGDGPSFHLLVNRTGTVKLTAHRWLCADGQYEGEIPPEAVELLYSMFEDLKSASPSPPPFWTCPHAPAFWVMEVPAGSEPFVTNSCVSKVTESPLAQFYVFAGKVAATAAWTQFTPDADARPALEPQLLMLRPLPIRKSSPWR